MADKEDKQSARNPGSKRETQAGRGREDAVSRTEMLKRLAEVPVFGIALNGRFLTAADGAASFYLDAREAHQMLQKMSDERLCVEGLPLSEVYFDPKTRLKAAYSALRELESLPVTSRLLPNIKVPLFCMDGLQTTDKKTGTASLPMFNSKAELLEFAKMASMDPSKVLATDLSVVVGNMLNGPAGLLRNAKFFADNKAIRWMDENTDRSTMFPAQLSNKETTGSDAPAFRTRVIPPPPPGGTSSTSASPPLPGRGGRGAGLFDGLKGLFPR